MAVQQVLERYSWLIVALVMILVFAIILRWYGRKKDDQIRAMQKEVEKQREDSWSHTRYLLELTHDLRSSLHTILGSAELLKLGNAEVGPTADAIIKSTEVLSELTSDLTELSILETGRARHRVRLMEVEEFRDRITDKFRRAVELRNLEFQTRWVVKHPYMYIDEQHTEMIVTNLVSNAIKYTPEGGRITYTVTERVGDKPDTCIMESVIEDNGVGMAPEFVSQIFERYAREQHAIEHGVPGTGLGMTIVKKLVELQEGTIEVRSTKGEGTTVTVRIPCKIGTSPEMIENRQTYDQQIMEGRNVPKDRYRILLAEDNQLNAEITMELLRAAGYQVDHALDGRICVEMLEQAEPGTYALVLMDIRMPNMNGYEASSAIRCLEDPVKANIPIYAITTTSDEDDIRKELDSGINGRFLKPIHREEFLGRIAGECRRRDPN